VDTSSNKIRSNNTGKKRQYSRALFTIRCIIKVGSYNTVYDIEFRCTYALVRARLSFSYSVVGESLNRSLLVLVYRGEEERDLGNLPLVDDSEALSLSVAASSTSAIESLFFSWRKSLSNSLFFFYTKRSG